MDYGDTADAPFGLLQGVAGISFWQPPRLEAQQRRDRLQVVLYPVMDFTDGYVLPHQEPVPPA